MHGLKQSSPTWPSSLSPKLRLPFPSPAFPTCSPKLFPFLRPSGFALQPWGLWDPGVCLFAEGFHRWGSWNQLLPEVSAPPVCAEPLSSSCHLLCTGIPLLLSPRCQGHQALTHTSSLLCRVLKDQERTAGERISPKIPEGGFFPLVLWFCFSASPVGSGGQTAHQGSAPSQLLRPFRGLSVCAVHEAGRGGNLVLLFYINMSFCKHVLGIILYRFTFVCGLWIFLY